MHQEIRINIFDKKTAKSIIAYSSFDKFLEKYIINNVREKILEIPWDSYQAILSDLIVMSLNNFKNTRSVDNKIHIPENGLKGVYFCIGDDGLVLSIGGSLYFNEADWAANADFDPKINDEKVCSIINELLEKLKLLKLEQMIISDLICCFMAYTVYKSVIKATNINEISNALVALALLIAEVIRFKKK